MKSNQSAKRVDIVSIKLFKEVSAHSHSRTIHRPDDGYTLVKKMERLDWNVFPRRQPGTRNNFNSIRCSSKSLSVQDTQYWKRDESCRMIIKQI